MKKLAFFILLSLVTLGVSAQSNLKWNVNAGIGMSNWYGDDTDGTDAKFAYKVGIGLEVPFANTNVPQIRNYAPNMIQKRKESASLVKRGHSASNVTIKTYKCPLPHHAT